jgi:hypothetical protein
MNERGEWANLVHRVEDEEDERDEAADDQTAKSRLRGGF